MNHNCPNCKAHIKPFSMKIARTDRQGRKAGKLDYLHICPHCEETLTRNKHRDELGLCFLVVFIPSIMVWFGVVLDSMATLFFAIVVCITASSYSYYHYKYRLKERPRWIQYSEYLSSQ